MEPRNILNQVATELAQRFEEQTGELCKLLSEGLVDAVLKMEDLYVQGSGVLVSWADNPSALTEDEVRAQQRAIRCILAYARIGANSFHKTMLEREAEAPKLEPMQLEEVHPDLRQLFTKMGDRWNSGIGEQNFKGLTSAILEHFREVQVILSNNRPDHEHFDILCADICNHFAALIHKMNHYKENQ